MKIKTGIGVIIYKSGQVLIGQRIGSHGANTWSFPGGHLEEGEKPEATARRELFEETGLKVNILSPAGFTFDYFEEPIQAILPCSTKPTGKAERLKFWRRINASNGVGPIPLIFRSHCLNL